MYKFGLQYVILYDFRLKKQTNINIIYIYGLYWARICIDFDYINPCIGLKKFKDRKFKLHYDWQRVVLYNVAIII